MAIGNPFGLGGTVTQGIVSARQQAVLPQLLRVQEIDFSRLQLFALKAVVDDLKTRQLTKIREDVKRVESTCSAAVSALDNKYMEGLDMVNIRVDELLHT